MDTLSFLTSVLGQEGHYCLFVPKGNKHLVHKFYETVQELVDGAKFYDAEGHHAYFALATFETPTSRKAANVCQMKSLFVDLDCGVDDSKHYINKAAALADLKRVCKELVLPRPMIVDSGRGLHAYWHLTEAVTREAWLPVALQFKRTCMEAGLRLDPAVTADAARVLRVPETHNHKDTPPSRVSVLGVDQPKYTCLDDFSELLGGTPIPVPMVRGVYGSNALTDMLAGNKEHSFKRIISKTLLGKGCDQIKHLMLHQDEISEPMWRAGLSIAKFCTDGEKAAQKISRNHPEYSFDETVKKLALIKGPYLCERFAEENPDVCDKCPHYGKIKSPIVLGTEVVEATPTDNLFEVQPIDVEPEDRDAVDIQGAVLTIPPFPKPYFRGKNGGVYIRVRTDEGDIEEVPIYHNDLYVVSRIHDIEEGECIILRLHLPRDGVREFVLPLTAVTSKDEFRRNMSKQGVAVQHMDKLMKYITDWVTELQSRASANDAHRQYGWTPKMKSFVLGRSEITAGHTYVNHPSIATRDTIDAFEPKGTLKGWKNAISFYNRDSLAMHQFVVCASLASPLMELVPDIHAAGLHIHSTQSGLGKTTLLNAALSIWGDPKELHIVGKDTDNFSMNRAEVYKNIPFGVDEITALDPQKLSDYVYALTGGKQKGRMSGGANQERFRGAPWGFLAISTGQSSCIERISSVKAAPKAEAQRLLETQAKVVEFIDKNETDRFNTDLGKHHGHAGRIVIQYMLRNLDEMQELYRRVQITVDKKFNLGAPNRFWSTFVAHALVGCIIGNKLDLIHFKASVVMTYAGELIKENRAAAISMEVSVEAILNEYLSEHWGSILQIKSTQDLRGVANNNGLDVHVLPEMNPKTRLVARYETDTHKVFLVPKALKAWCVKKQINYAGLTVDLKVSLGATKAKMRLGKGTRVNLPPTDVIVVDCTDFCSDFEGAPNEDGLE